MEKTRAHRLPRVVLNERRRRAVKLRLSGATIAETVVLCELSRSAVIRAKRASERAGWKVFSGTLNAKILIGFMKRLVHARVAGFSDPGQPARALRREVGLDCQRCSPVDNDYFQVGKSEACTAISSANSLIFIASLDRIRRR